jgi:rhamnosyltransferase subunit B
MRIVFTPWGSLGDLHPYLAVALEMKRRGHTVTIATSGIYQEKVEGEGLNFHAVRPDMSMYLQHPEYVAKAMSAFKGPEFLFRKMLMPSVEAMYEDISAAAQNADLLVSHVAMVATPLVAEKQGLPWISATLQPALLWSAFDPPALPFRSEWLRLFPGLTRAFLALVRKETRRWVQEVYRLRRKLGLRTEGTHPLFEGQFSPWGTVALFSALFASPQPDWPPHTVVAGFPFYDKLHPKLGGLSRPIQRFLEAGEPPIVFTLGSTAVFVPSNFYQASLHAAKKLGRRAILLAGPEFQKRTTLRSTETVLVSEYAPYSQLFPRAAAVVHSGGVGTTAQALRAGKPMVIVPFSHDQPDNAARIERLGIGKTIRRWNYGPHRVARQLHRLLSDADVVTRAAAIGKAVEEEDGITAAGDAIEELASRG